MKPTTTWTRKFAAGMAALVLVASAAGCDTKSTDAQAKPSATQTASPAETTQAAPEATQEEGAESTANFAVTEIPDSLGGVFNAADQFTEADLAQGVDTAKATRLTLADGQDLTISEEGVYVVSGSATDATIRVEAADTAKVHIVLDNASITNGSKPAIYVLSADKVFVTLEGENSLSVTGQFEADGTTNIDAAIFSKEDLCLNGTGSLAVASPDNGITSKDDLKITGGTYTIEASAGHALEANDSVRVAGGTLSLKAGTDGIHADNDEDDSLGYIYICGGDFQISAGSDAAEATSVAQLDGGSFTIDSAEGIEATYVQINEGNVDITASDDGINATATSTAYETSLEINGGTVKIDMGQGDTDALDSNGNLIINGGTVDITAQFAFDFDGQGTLNGGTVTVNGEQVTSIENSMMGGGPGGHGGMGPGGEGGMGPGGQGGMAPGGDGGMRQRGM